MKKFILIFFSSLIFNNFSYASIIEFGKCYGSYKEELWNEENYNIAKIFTENMKKNLILKMENGYLKIFTQDTTLLMI